MHSPESCERCQYDTVLYGRAYFNGETDEHYDPPILVIAMPHIKPHVAEAIRRRLEATQPPG